MGMLLSLNASCQLIADSAGARPDHPISGPSPRINPSSLSTMAPKGTSVRLAGQSFGHSTNSTSLGRQVLAKNGSSGL
jgi:hypothetical protein